MKLTKLFSLASFALAIPAVHAATIFSDNFDGTGALNGTTPDETTGAAAWVSSTAFNADGTFLAGSTTNGSSATLLYTPTAGEIYTLDARVDVTSTTGWIALGFASGQSTANSPNARFVTGSTPLGRVWMLMGASGGGSVFQDGTTNQNAENTINVTGAIDMRIVLDTTATTWTSTWYAKDATVGSYTVIKSTEDVLSQGSINSVGFALSGNSVPGTITSFSLTAIPEPSTALLGGLSLLALLRRRR